MFVLVKHRMLVQLLVYDSSNIRWIGVLIFSLTRILKQEEKRETGSVYQHSMIRYFQGAWGAP